MRTSVKGFSIGPEFTAQALKWLIIVTSVSSLALPFVDVLMGAIFKITGLQTLFSLTWMTISRWFLWQPLTHLFILQSHGGITFGLFISLAFRMYLLWVMGSTLIERYGIYSFLRLYFGGGILAAMGVLGVMAMTGYRTPYVGNTASLFTIFTVWAMMNPRGTIYLFFLIPISVKWLFAGATGANLLINLSEGNPFGCIATLLAVGFGYLYAAMAWGLQTPFPQTHNVDDFVSHCGDWVYEKWSRVTRKDHYAKIYSKNHRKDDAFVDAMLDKIAKHGEKSLWFWERWRLRRISKRKS